jgi:hypothetical protein
MIIDDGSFDGTKELVQKWITENGIYYASDEGANVVGYDMVTVHVPSVEDKTNAILNRTIIDLDLQTAGFITQYALAYCTSLETVNAPGLMAVGTNAFTGCTKLKNLNVPKLTGIEGGSTMSQAAFGSCTSLEEIYLPVCSHVGAFAFFNCSKLSKVEIGKRDTYIEASAFARCSALTTLIVNSVGGTPVLSNTNAFAQTPIASGTGFIYTDNPDMLKAADNWSTYAAQIKSKDELPIE